MGEKGEKNVLTGREIGGNKGVGEGRGKVRVFSSCWDCGFLLASFYSFRDRGR